MITIHLFLFRLASRDYSLDIQDLSNLYKGLMVFSFFPVIKYWYEQGL